MSTLATAALSAALQQSALTRVDRSLSKLFKRIQAEMETPADSFNAVRARRFESFDLALLGTDISAARRECQASGIPFAEYNPALAEAAGIYAELSEFASVPCPPSIDLSRGAETDELILTPPGYGPAVDAYTNVHNRLLAVQARMHAAINKLVAFRDAVLAEILPKESLPNTGSVTNTHQHKAMNHIDPHDPLQRLEAAATADAAAVERQRQYQHWWDTRLPEKALVMHAVRALGDFNDFDNAKAVEDWGRELHAASALIRKYQLEGVFKPEPHDKLGCGMAKAACLAAIRNTEDAIRAAQHISLAKTYRREIGDDFRHLGCECGDAFHARLQELVRLEFPDLFPAPTPFPPPVLADTASLPEENPNSHMEQQKLLENKRLFAELATAAKALNLKKSDLKIVSKLVEAGGEAQLADLALLCRWAIPLDGLWNSARIRLNKKLKKHDWRVETHDRKARAIKIKSSARK